MLFRSDWNNASIELSDVKIAFNRVGTKIDYSIALHQSANIELQLPVQCKEIKSVVVNGEKTRYELMPGFGCSILKIIIAKTYKINVSIKTGETLPYYPPVNIESNVDDVLKILAEDAQILSVEDPQGVLMNEKIENGILTAKLIKNKGYHTVVTKTMVFNAPQYRIFRIQVKDKEGDRRQAERFMDTIPANASWSNVDISALCNADIRNIYKQHYLSPRPNTVSARLGTDGYSPWTFPYWKSKPPIIETNKLKSMLKEANKLVIPQGIPFSWNESDKNIAFTSIWNNFPPKIDFPVNQKGDGIYFLVSGSTNVMQCQIANAVIRLNYADGQRDSLELIPPQNYWNLSTIDSHATAPGQGSRTDYTSEIDRFCMPAKLPETVQLGNNCRAMLLNLRMRKDIELKSISLETLSQEVVVGLIGITIMKRND